MKSNHSANRQNRYIKCVAFSGVFLALALVLPFLIGQIPQIGRTLNPIHIPVLLCGFICGWPWGLAVGFVAPLLRGVLFGTPVLIPGGVSMAFELAVYGAVSGFLYRVLPKRVPCIYIALLVSMVLGRLAWGLLRFIIAGFLQTEFPLSAFWAGAVTTAIPGIICQIVLVPLLVLALKRGGLMFNEPSLSSATR